MKSFTWFVILLCFAVNVCFAQASKIADLEVKLKKSQPDTNRLRLLQQIGDAYTSTDMMKKLKSKKLIHYQPYQGFKLNAEGKKVALSIIRRHRLWEYFLSEKLKFEWDEVHEVAEELEHVSSKKLIDKLDEYLGYPRFDPHGDPIPDTNGKMENYKKN